MIIDGIELSHCRLCSELIQTKHKKVIQHFNQNHKELLNYYPFMFKKSVLNPEPMYYKGGF